jgi:hypothetical protein
LWLKNLTFLYHNATPNLFDDKITHVDKGETYSWTDTKTGKIKTQPLWYAQANGNTRSKTFPGIALAMATQWG